MLDRLLMANGLKKDPTGRPAFIWAERMNGPVFGVILACGIPFLALSDYSLEFKWEIATYWFVAMNIYMMLELRELLGQMSGRGSLDTRQVSWQIMTGLMPPIGVLFALVCWLQSETWLRVEMTFGRVEWSILGYSSLIFIMSLAKVIRLAIDLSKSAPRGERSERRLPGT